MTTNFVNAADICIAQVQNWAAGEDPDDFQVGNLTLQVVDNSQLPAQATISYQSIRFSVDFVSAKSIKISGQYSHNSNAVTFDVEVIYQNNYWLIAGKIGTSDNEHKAVFHGNVDLLQNDVLNCQPDDLLIVAEKVGAFVSGLLGEFSSL